MRYVKGRQHINKKIRRHSGRITPGVVKGINKQFLIDNCIEPQSYWDDWMDYRDGQRNYDDRSKLRSKFSYCAKYLKVSKWNKKIKKKLKIRKCRERDLNPRVSPYGYQISKRIF